MLFLTSWKNTFAGRDFDMPKRGGDGGKRAREALRKTPPVSCRVAETTRLGLILIAHREQTTVANVLSRAVDDFLRAYLAEDAAPDTIRRNQQPEKPSAEAGIPWNRGSTRTQVCVLLTKDEASRLTQEAHRRGISRSAHIAGLLQTHQDNRA